MAKLQRAAEQVKVNVRVERVRCAPIDTATDTDTFTDSTRVSDRFQCVPRCAKPTVNWNFNSTLPLPLQPTIHISRYFYLGESYEKKKQQRRER